MISYEKYKTSSCDWIDSIPSHWDTHRIKMLFSLRDERNYKPLNEVNLISLYTSWGVRQHKDIEHTTGNKARNADGYKIVYPDDIVVNILLCWMGAIGRSDYYGVTSPAYDIYKPKTKSVNTKYYNYLMRTPMFAQQCYRAGKGIMAMRWRTYSPQFSNIVVPVPSRDEQDQIVRFLDWKTSSINKLINQKRKEITEIEELKKLLIYRVATKGLNANVPMKNSETPWLGEIPRHWELGKAKRFIRITNGSDPKTNGSIPVYGSGKEPFKTCGEYKEGSTVLLGRKGSIKNPIFIEGRYWNVDTAFDVKPISNDYLLKYYYYLALCFDYDYYTTQTAIPSMTQTDYENMYLPVPSIAEQENIVCYLNEKCEGVDLMIGNLQSYIQTLQELKTQLISDVVTGKIDVRGVEIPEYEYVDDDMTDTDEENESEELTEEQEE